MPEPGSDELFAELADAGAIEDAVRAEARRLAEEEQRTAAATPAGGEPGADYPDPDETPAGDGPDYDPVPT